MVLHRKVIVSLAVSVICGSGVLVLTANVADLWGLPIVAHIPDPLPIPCRVQNWTNADRICLSWTAPRDKMRQATVAATERDRRGTPAISTTP